MPQDGDGDAVTYTVSGTVTGTPAAGGLSVQLVDKNVGGDATLVTGTTGPAGDFTLSVPVPAGYLAGRRKSAPDLQVQVLLGGNVAASSAVRYGAPAAVTLDVAVPAGAPGLASEHEALTAALASLYDGPLAALEENGARQDITYLASRSGWDARAVAMASLAAQLSAAHPDLGVDPAFYYALLRAGLAADPGTLYQADPGTVQRIWAQALSQEIIPRQLKAALPAAVRAFTSLAAASALAAPPTIGVSGLGGILDVTFPGDADSQQRFAGIYARYRGEPEQLWAQAAAAFGADVTARLQLAGQLAYLTVNNGPLISALHQAAGDTPITAPADLVARGYHRASAWAPLVSQVSVPAQIPGATAEEQAANYAELLAAQVRLSFPTAVMGQLVSDGTVPVLGGPELSRTVAGFLASAQGDFDIGGEPVARYLARTRAGDGLDPAAVEQVTRIQRVNQMAPNARSLTGLLRAGVDSAYHVATGYSPQAFVAKFADAVGGADTAIAVHAQATAIYSTTLSLAVGYLSAKRTPLLGSAASGPLVGSLMPGPGPGAGPAAAPGDPPVFAQATLEELFGNLDYCACDDCRSVLSPAAYLVDLLDWIDVPTAAPPAQNPQSVLLSRRPDIAALPLTCDNTNIGLPYIDLVNETLEYYVASFLSLAGYPGHNTDGSLTSEELIAAPQYDETPQAAAAYDTLKRAWGPAPLPFDRSLEQLRLLAASLGLSLHDLMTRLRDTEDLERGGPSPGGGTTGYAWRDILAERLSLSRPEYKALTDSAAVPLAGLYGLPAGTADADAAAALGSLQEFARRAGVSYTEAADILRATFINPHAELMPLVDALAVGFTALRQLHAGSLSVADFTALLPAGLDLTPYGGDVSAWVNANYDQIMGLIVIDVPSSAPCDTALMRLSYADPASAGQPLPPADLLRIARFIRLWRKLGLSIQLTDALLAALAPAAAAAAPDPAHDLDQRFLTFLPRAGLALEAADALGADRPEDLPGLLACWASIGTAGAGSLYARMFLTPAMLRADPAFRPVLPDTAAGTGSLLDHQAALCAAFNLTGAEFGLITGGSADGGLGYGAGTPLTLPAISAIYRRGWLARTLRLSVRELLLLVKCTGLDPFAGPPDLAPTDPVEPLPLTRLARLVAAIAGAGLTTAQALYLLWNVDLSGTSAPPAAVTTGLAMALRQALADVDTQFTVKDDPTGAFTKSLLAQVAGPGPADYFFGLLTGTVTTSVDYAAPTPALPQPVLDAGRQRLSYDDFAKKLSFAGPLAPGDPTATAMASAAAALAAAGAGGDPALVTAVSALADACAAATAPFFATYGDIGQQAPGGPGLQALAQAFVASADPPPQRYATLLAALAGSLATRRKEQQALNAVTAAAACDPGWAAALLRDPAVLHSADRTSAAAGDLLAAAVTGLDVTYDGAAAAPPYATLSYGPGQPLPAPAAGHTTISAKWTGYLRAPQDGDYNIQVTADAGATVSLAVNDSAVTLQRSAGTWKNGQAIALTAGALAPVTITAVGVSATFTVTWEARGATGWQPVPASALFPATVVANIRATYTRFLKLTALASALALTAADVAYLASAASLAAGGGLWTDALAVSGQPTPATSADLRPVLDAVIGYAELKAAYSPGTQLPGAGRLRDVLTALAASSPVPVPGLLALTGWDQPSLTALTGRFYGTASPGGITVAGTALAPLTVLRRLHEAFAVVKSSGVTASALIAAATNAPEPAAAAGFQAAVRSRYAEADWLATIKPVNDALRRLRRDALVAHILVQAGPKVLTALGIDPRSRACTADDLFGYFLFDPQMEPCMETSRIRHALSSVQLFIERSLRNLEPTVSPSDVDDGGQWAWRSRYRVWQANREVFLWPENWLDEGLRDDGSPLCATTVKQLVQSDITDNAAAVAYLGYLSGLEQVAKLEPCGVCYEPPADGGADYTAHVIARTSGAHRKHFYRRYASGAWTPWEEIPLSIEGVPVIPYVWDGRLMLFWLQVQHSPAVTPSAFGPGAVSGAGAAQNDPTIGDIAKSFSSSSSSGSSGGGSHSASSLHLGDMVKGAAADAGGGGSQALSNVSLTLCYSELYNGKWQPVRTSDHDSPLPWAGPLDYTLFDRTRLVLWPWRARDTTDQALYLQVTRYDQNSGVLRAEPGIGHHSVPGKGFVLYNTHSAPVPWSTLTDVPFATPARPRTLLLDRGRLWAGYYPGFTPGTYTPPTGFYSVVTAKSPLPLSFVEAQPGVADQWDLPFFLSDARNAFYVTTRVGRAPVGGFHGVLIDGAYPAGLAADPDLVTLSGSPPAAALTADLAGDGGARRALELRPELRWVLESPATITFNGAVIGFAGQEKPS